MGDLLKDGLGSVVQPTGLSKKITIDGVTKPYPVYKVRLDQLFYNDQNDRIASWISQYRNSSEADISRVDRERYNEIIERFIIESNEVAIERTKLNIQLVQQREPGVVLADGRIIDGNRRFTCLRALAKEDEQFNWFETVILEATIESSRKQIKMLELAIQHGEEKKVDYNPIDRLVGVYQDIVEEQLLTIEEYAQSTNESVQDVKRRIEQAKLLVEFLEFIHMPKQYLIARDYQVVSILTDLQTFLKRFDSIELKEKVKNAVFMNIMMGTIEDGRKYMRELASMMESGFFTAYIKDQEKIGEQLAEDLSTADLANKADLDFFISQHDETAEDLHMALDKSLLRAKKHETRNRPSQIISKSITLLRDVDTNIFEKLNDGEREKLREQIGKLATVVNRYDTLASGEDVVDEEPEEQSTITRVVHSVKHEEKKTRYFAAPRHPDEPAVSCPTAGSAITNLVVSIPIEVAAVQSTQRSELHYRVFFIDEENEIISDVKDVVLPAGQKTNCLLSIQSSASQKEKCYLAMQSSDDGQDEVQQLIPFVLRLSFTSGLDFD